MEFAEIYGLMSNEYETLTGNTITGDSDLGIRMKLVAGQLHSLVSHMDFLERQMFMDTAEGSYLDAHAAEHGLTRSPANTFQGVARIYIPSAQEEDIEIPQGTQLAADDELLIRYTTEVSVTIPAGALATNVAIIANGVGSQYHLKQNTSLQVIDATSPIYVDVLAVSQAGTDAETDESLRARLLDSCKNLSNGCNQGYYRRFLLGFDEVADVSITAPTNRELTIYVAPKADNFSANYVNSMRSKLTAQRELGMILNLEEAARQPIDISLSILMDPNCSLQSVEGMVENSLRNCLCAVKIGTPLLLRNLYAALDPIQEIRNFTFTNITTDQYIPANTIPRLGKLSILEA